MIFPSRREVTMATYLVTGASGGIGTALSERLAKSGHRLVVAARDLTKLSALENKLKNVSSVQHVVLELDMASITSIRAFAGKLADHSIDLDGAIIMPPQPHRAGEPMPEPEVWRALFEESFIGPLETLKVAISRMMPEPANGHRCKVVIVSGISSAQVLSHYATANVIRTAWVGEAKTLAFALGPRGIHVNTLSLGGTLSPWYRDSIAKRAASAAVSFEDQLKQENENVPLKKYAEPAEVAIAIEGLLSPFSDHMTGLNIMCDGGFTRAY
jgi:3-oxoacyl-[acyl-carrier protein] reductase